MTSVSSNDYDRPSSRGHGAALLGARRGGEAESTGDKGVTVVTATWNELETLASLISGIRQTLKHVPHEIIVVDDASPDRTYSLASKLADRAICKKREGQSIALLTGIREAMYPFIVTIDADLENDPANIPKLLEKLAEGYDLVVASRPQLPRWSERLFATTIGRRLGIKDVLSNFRAMRAEKVKGLRLDHGETFGAEFLIKAHMLGLRLGQIQVQPTRRRGKPRIGGAIKANLRILKASLTCLFI